MFASLTVQENLELALLRSRGKHGVGAAIAEAYDLFPRLRDRHRQLAGTLSGGEQRMLSLSRVLVDKPRLLIADELSLGLAIADDVIVLVKGEVSFSGPVAELGDLSERLLSGGAATP